MAKYIIGRQQLYDEFATIPKEKTIAYIGAFYYPGKLLTFAHTVNLIKMKMLYDITILSLYNPTIGGKSLQEIDDIIQTFKTQNPDILADYIYIDKDMFSTTSKYTSLNDINSNITNTEEWKWYEQNTDLVSIFQEGLLFQHNCEIALSTIVLFPRETERIRLQWEGLTYALADRGIVWIRGINDILSDLKYVWKLKYPTFTDYPLQPYYAKAVSDGLIRKRIYLPTVMYPSGRSVRNTSYLSEKLSQPHIFNDIKTFDYKNSTIIEFKNYVASKIPDGNFFALINLEGKIPTTEDMNNKRLLLCVYGIDPNYFVYEPLGEITLVGMGDDEILVVDYTNNHNVEFQTHPGLSAPNQIISNTYTEKCLTTATAAETGSIIKSDLYNNYSSSLVFVTPEEELL